MQKQHATFHNVTDYCVACFFIYLLLSHNDQDQYMSFDVITTTKAFEAMKVKLH